MKTDLIEQGVKLILEGIGEDLNREGLQETPKRVAKAYAELCGGYEIKPKEGILLRTFTENFDELIMQRNIEFYSMCEHHMLPFIGKAHVGYVANGKVVGLSKLARLVDVYARRLQVQERMTHQIAHDLQDALQPTGVAVVVEAAHMCMACRGVNKQHSDTVTSTMLGCFLDPSKKARDEFLHFIRGK